MLCELEKGACPEWQDLWFEANEAPAPPAVDLFNLNEPQVAAEIAHGTCLEVSKWMLYCGNITRNSLDRSDREAFWECNVHESIKYIGLRYSAETTEAFDIREYSESS